MIDIDEYEKMTPWGTPSDELADAIDDLLAEVKRLQDYNTALLHWVMYHLDKDENEVKEMIYE